MRHVATTLLLLTLGACASAEKRFERGARLEREGRPLDAADHYIDALRKDPQLADARVRLRAIGDSLVTSAVRTATHAETTGRAIEGADLLLRVSALRTRAAAVGVDIPVPDDYALLLRRLMDGAVDALIAEGAGYTASGDWSRALGRYERATSTYQPDAAQRHRLDAGRLATRIAWAESELDRKRFRAAHERAEEALQLALRLDAEADAGRLRRVQARAVELGTRRVALLPLRATERSAARLPDDLLAAFNDALVFEQWSRPPPFLAVVPPAELNRELRRLGQTRGVISTADAAALARDLRAPFAVAMEVDSVRRTERDVRTTRRPARTRAGVDTAFVVEQGRTDLEVRISFAVIDVAARRAVDHGTVRLSQNGRFQRARYEGDYRDLDLRRADLDLFRNEGTAGTERDLVRSTVDEGAPRLAAAVWERLLRRVE